MAGDAYPSIRVVKTTSFRGNALHEWSNRYHFRGGTPADAGHWETFRANVVNAEKLCFTGGIHIVKVYGYAAGSDVPVFSWAGSVAGTNASSGNPQMSEICALCRWTTDQRTKFNHPIYLFSYWHGVNASVGDGNLLDATQRNAMITYAQAWDTGFSDGTNTLNRGGPNGAAGTTPYVDTYLRTHSFPK